MPSHSASQSRAWAWVAFSRRPSSAAQLTVYAANFFGAQDLSQYTDPFAAP